MSGPSSSDYKPGKAEIASADVAKKEKAFFRSHYGPILRRMRDEAAGADSLAQTTRGIANADLAQGLGISTYQESQRLPAVGERATATMGQLSQGQAAALDVKNKMSSNVLGIAREQAADAQTGMAEAARLEASDALAMARAKQTEAHAMHGALAQMGTAAVLWGGSKLPKGGVGDKFRSFLGHTDEISLDKKPVVRGPYDHLYPRV